MGRTMARTLIHGGLVVTPGGTGPLDILVDGETIAALLRPGEPVAAERRIDARGLVVLPGAIDAHTHFVQVDPDEATVDPAEQEGFAKGGRGAAAGGVTTVVEMPQGAPTTVTGRQLQRKRALAGEDAIVDFALWGGVCAGQPAEDVLSQVEAGAAGLKAFMCDSDPSFPGVDDAQILATLELLRDTGLMFGVHAENDALLQGGIARMRAAGRIDPRAHAESRPPVVEMEAVSRAIFFAEVTGGWIHIVHLSAPGAAELVRAAKARGVQVTAETCPQYLVLDLDDLDRLGPWARCAPALRSRDEVEELWDYLADGTLDCITSDHCAYTLESKQAGAENIWTAPLGLSGIQTLLPVVISEARRRGFSWDDIAALTATTPAALWSLDQRKGAIHVGADADFALVDPDREWTVTSTDLLHAFPWSPFEGMTLRGRVVRTVLRGETIFDDAAPERVLVGPGYGRYAGPR